MSFAEWIEWMQYLHMEAEQGEAAANPKQSWPALQASLLQHSKLVKNRGGH